MNRAEVNAKLKEGIALAQAGQRTEARRVLTDVTRADPSQELAWMWLASVSTDRGERIGYLERALALNPHNPTTQRAYEQLTGGAYAAAPSSTERPNTRPGVLAALGREAPISLSNFLTIMLLGTIAVIVIVVVVNLREDQNTTKTTSPGLILPIDLPTATPLLSLTPSPTPFPTITLGPSPTSVWSVAATWTPSAIPSVRPTSTPRPTSTDTLTPTLTMTSIPFTATFTTVPATATRRPPQPTLRPPDTDTPEPVEPTATETPVG